MKKLLLVLTVVAMASFLLVGCFGTTPPPDEVVTIAAIPGVTAPVTGAAPVTAITATAQYTGVVTWLPDDATFAAETVYTATITLTPATGFTLTGVVVDFFTVAGATAANLVDSGVVAALFPATGPAPVINVAPVITSTAVLTATVGEVYTYTVVASDANAVDVLAYSLVGPAGMNINSATGLINWTPTLAGSYVVNVVVSDGALTATQSFTVVASDPVVLPFVDTIVYDADYFYDDGTTKFVRSGAVDVEVTLYEALVAGESLTIQWNDGSATGGLDTLTLKTGETLVYEGTLDFDGLWADCMLVCVEVSKSADCCPDQTFADIVKVDKVDPYADLYVTFLDCTEDCDPAPTSANFSFTSTEDAECGPEECCGDDCSGFKSWSLEIVPATDCDPYCELIPGTTCPVYGETSCGCLDYATTGTLSYEVIYTLTDNVGNEFEDTWTIVVDTDSVVSVDVPLGVDIATVVFDTEYGIYTGECDTEE